MTLWHTSTENAAEGNQGSRVQWFFMGVGCGLIAARILEALGHWMTTTPK